MNVRVSCPLFVYYFNATNHRLYYLPYKQMKMRGSVQVYQGWIRLKWLPLRPLYCTEHLSIVAYGLKLQMCLLLNTQYF